MLRELPWEFNLGQHLLLSAAGRFLLKGPDFPEWPASLGKLQGELSRWLLEQVSGELRVSLIGAPDAAGSSEMQQYLGLIRSALDRVAMRPWSSLAIAGESWEPEKMVLAPLDAPCQICRRRPGSETEVDPESGESRRVCTLCRRLLTLGLNLPRARWLVFSDAENPQLPSAFALGIQTLEGQTAPSSQDVLAAAQLSAETDPSQRLPAKRRLSRNLARYVPSSPGGGPATFDEIARQSAGDAKLGVFKADGDGLGAYLEALFGRSSTLREYRTLSGDLDDFSAREIDNLVRRKYRWIYTVFSGGDDLLYVGPWDQVLDFAGEVRNTFVRRFQSRDLRLSAGVAIVSAHRPVRRAVSRSEDLLERAKSTVAPGASGPKDQIAALGMVWKWNLHSVVLDSAKRLARWVRTGAAERGWLQTVLEQCEAREGRAPRLRLSRAPDGRAAWQADPRDELLASARLSYLVARNFPSANHNNPDKAALRRWIDQRLAGLENPQATDTETLYLPAILRYAILATRTRSDHDE